MFHITGWGAAIAIRLATDVAAERLLKITGMALRPVQVNIKALDDAALGRFRAEALGWVFPVRPPV